MSEDTKTLEQRVVEAIDQVRPSLQADGGDIQFVSVNGDGEVHVQLHGACRGCPMAQMTISQGVEVHLKSVVPEVSAVIAD